MLVKVKGRDRAMSIRWTHRHPEKDSDYLEFENIAIKKQSHIKGATRCTLAMLDKEGNKEIVAITQAWCSVKDPYNKERGRKISLTRALNEAGLNKEERTQVWEAYLNRK